MFTPSLVRQSVAIYYLIQSVHLYLAGELVELGSIVPTNHGRLPEDRFKFNSDGREGSSCSFPVRSWY